MSTPSVVDGLLEEWGETFFNPAKFWGPQGRPPGSRRPGRVRRPVAGSTGSGGSIRQGKRYDAQAVRQNLQNLLKQSPQVMVKVYGGGRGMKQVRVHLRYIARAGREGKVVIEDQDGFRSLGVDAIRELAEDWQHGDAYVEEVSSRREAVNMVLSMPAGTDPIAVQKAARDFAAREFSNHKYAMALHTVDTPHYAEDPSDAPSPHPHVHLIVQTAGKDGTRLSPRKPDLHRWREGFAQSLRDQGVDAAATSRAHRLQRNRGEPRAVRQMKDRGKPFSRARDERGAAGRMEKAKATEKAILERYREAARILMSSADPTDHVLAMQLAKRFSLERPRPSPESRLLEPDKFGGATETPPNRGDKVDSGAERW